MLRVKIKKGSPQNLYKFPIHDTLNKHIWDELQLKEEVREKLLKISQAFLDFLKIDTEIKDVRLTGSLANYNYSKYSDLDLHIVLDFSEIDENLELVSEYLRSKKKIWNDLHDIKIKDYEVEVYPENVNEKHFSTGVYSVLNNEWIEQPEKDIDKHLDVQTIVDKVESLVDKIEDASGDLEKLKKAKEKIINMRKAGLEEGGEYSIENLAFKVLRRGGYIGDLNQQINKIYDDQMSLEEAEGDIEFQKRPGFKSTYIKNRNALIRTKVKIKKAPFTKDPPEGFPESAPPLGQ
jgi:predicted nucleotidyltransferase